jgi:hypothetical protein
MRHRGLLERLLPALLALPALGCAGRELDTAGTPMQGSGSPSGDGGGLGGGALTDAFGPDAPATAPSPPIAIAGVSLWLDGDLGLSMGATGIDRWADRSGQGHVFLGQSVLSYSQQTMQYFRLPHPQPARVAGHGAVRFNGGNRMIVEERPSAAQQASLTFGQGGFLLAVVYQAEQLAPLQAYDISPLVVADGPWISEPPYTNVPPTTGLSVPFRLEFSTAGLEASAAGLSVDLGKGYGPGPTHMLVVKLDATTLSVRTDGQPLDSNSNGSVQGPLDYEPIYVGNWDFSDVGFIGAVAEVVVLKGAPSDATVATLEGYLKTKYRL